MAETPKPETAASADNRTALIALIVVLVFVALFVWWITQRRDLSAVPAARPADTFTIPEIELEAPPPFEIAPAEEDEAAEEPAEEPEESP